MLTVAFGRVCANGNQVNEVSLVASMKMNMVQNRATLTLLCAANHKANCNSQILKVFVGEKPR